jgi:adenine-specific DNA-methyltransferase
VYCHFRKLNGAPCSWRLPIPKAKMNPDLHMADELKNTGKGNLFVVFGEPDIDIKTEKDGSLRVQVEGAI